MGVVFPSSHRALLTSQKTAFLVWMGRGLSEELGKPWGGSEHTEELSKPTQLEPICEPSFMLIHMGALEDPLLEDLAPPTP